MARYIDGEQVVRELFSVIRPDGIYGRGFNRGIDIALAIVNRQDTADVVEVKRGHWVKHSPDVAAMRAFHKLGIGKGMNENSIFWTCSCCDSWGSLTQKYCNQCGAKMDGGIICKT